MFERLKEKGFNVLALHHAEAIISVDMPEAAAEIEAALLGLEIPITEIVAGGGGEARLTQRLRRGLADRDWRKRNIHVRKLVKWGENEQEREVASLSHEIDHVKPFGAENSVFALEIEWNNKDPFFDRDLENFKRLHAEGAVSVGGLITRGDSMQNEMRSLLRRFADEQGIDDIDQLDAFGYSPTRRQRNMIMSRAERTGDFRQAWVDAFVSDKFGEATTHWRKLQDRVLRGVGNPCPLVLIGIPSSAISF
ncbi:BglII/BstYI family type II restriction endonuclease [Mesorhizobium sp. YR577]|uniref:BglII/BstYI family type II restriction endonuclease n=1 Tax=Mesorhizobium sp. YR577 TaxID=1884373 RepID=UPI0008E39148|nr:BglII/BstYI family type II restriction endonuclease [Mesorhizobium sp. YR577]SFU02365.1 Restriction endonuclease BglII [Mesorhizobium sp. YR577]